MSDLAKRCREHATLIGNTVNTPGGVMFDRSELTEFARSFREAAAALNAPTPSEQRASAYVDLRGQHPLDHSAKPQDEAEMVLAKIKTLLNLPASILDSNDRAALAELRTYAATERDCARREAMEEARLAMRPVAFLVESTDYRAAFFHEDEAQERADKMSGGVYHGLYRRDPPQHNDAGEDEGRYVNCQAFYPHCTNKAKCAVCGGHVSEHRPVSPPTAAPDPLDQVIADGFEPIMAFDDRARVVKMWRARGIPCAQVAEGDF